MNSDLKTLLTGVRDGTVSVDDALLQLKMAPFTDIGYAKVDLHRKTRQGAAEVIYGAGKTPAQIVGILDQMCAAGQKTVLITRLSPESAAAVRAVCPLDYRPEARAALFGPMPDPTGIGTVVVATGGITDCMADVLKTGVNR